MIFRCAAVAVLCCLGAFPGVCRTGFAAGGQQQMLDFSLSGFGEKGKKSWDVFGKSADISSEVIRLFNITSTLYDAQDTVKITADTGDFDRRKGLLHLEKNVVVRTSSGATLTTEALDWDARLRLVSTDEPVAIRRQDLDIAGRGAEGLQDLKLVTVRTNVKVVSRSAAPADAQQDAPGEVTITCDGPLTLDYAHDKAVFTDNVTVVSQDGTMHSDLMDVYLVPSGKARDQGTGSSIETIVARGNVTVTQGENVSHSAEALYKAAEHSIVLMGKPEITLYPSEAQGAPAGDQGLK